MAPERGRSGEKSGRTDPGKPQAGNLFLPAWPYRDSDPAGQLSQHAACPECPSFHQAPAPQQSNQSLSGVRRRHLKDKGMLKIVVPVLVILAGGSISWAIATYRPPLKSSLPENEMPLVQVVRAEPRSVKLNIHSQGVVVPRTEIDLVPEVAGQIIQLHPSLVAGGFFQRGDVLLTIDPRDYDHAIAEAGARIAEGERQVAMEEAQAEQARQEWEVLGEGNPTPLTMREPQLAEARAKLKAARADMIKARVQRSRCEWRA